MKPKRLTYLFIGSMIFWALVAMLFGCNAVKNHRTLSKSESNSHVITSIDSLGKKSTDNRRLTNDLNVNKRSESTINEGDLVIEFQTDSPFTIHNSPLTIQRTKDGGVVIDPGGRRIKNINAKVNDANVVTDSSAKTNIVASHTSTADSVHEQKNTDAKTITQEKQVEKDKASLRTSWITIGVMLFVFMIAVFFFKYKDIIFPHPSTLNNDGTTHTK